MTGMGNIFYFGHWPKGLAEGAHLFLPSGHLFGGPCPWTEEYLWGTFCPEAQKQGCAQLTHLKGWTILAFWDRTAARQSNGNSAFVVRGTYTFDGVLALALEHYPLIHKRVGQVQLVSPSLSQAGGSLGVNQAYEEAWPY